MNLHAINCGSKAPECNRATLSIAQIVCQVVVQEFSGNQAFGWKWVFIETIDWLLILTTWILPCNDRLWNVWLLVVKVKINGVSMICSVHYQQSLGCIVISFQSESIGCLWRQKGMCHAHCPILKMSAIWASIIFGLESWIIQWLCNHLNP